MQGLVHKTLHVLPQELQMAGINFKAFDLGGHEIARRVWKDYYAKVRTACYALLGPPGASQGLLLAPGAQHM